MTPGVGEIHTDIGALTPTTATTPVVITGNPEPFVDAPVIREQTILQVVALLHQERASQTPEPGAENRPDVHLTDLQQLGFVPEDRVPAHHRLAEHVDRIGKVHALRHAGLRSLAQEPSLPDLPEGNKPGRLQDKAGLGLRDPLQAEAPEERQAGRLAAVQDDKYKEGVPI